MIEKNKAEQAQATFDATYGMQSSTDLSPVDAMTTGYRAMCAELVDALHEHICEYEGQGFGRELVVRARALLAQPVAEGPTDDKLMDIARATDLVYCMGKGRGFASPYMEGTDITEEVLAYARHVLQRYRFNSKRQA